jgi:hypothetical protein
MNWNAKRKLIAYCGALAGVAATVSVARGDTFGTACCGKADSKAHWACWVPDPGAANIPFALWEYLFDYLNDEVNVAAGITVPWSNTCEAGTDMFLDNRLSNPNNWGLQFCRTAVVNGICAESSVQINDSKIVTDAAAQGLWVEAVREFNWCHEGGHSLGLNHLASGSECLRSGVQTFTTYGSHHLGHLNNDL